MLFAFGRLKTNDFDRFVLDQKILIQMFATLVRFSDRARDLTKGCKIRKGKVGQDLIKSVFREIVKVGRRRVLHHGFRS